MSQTLAGPCRFPLSCFNYSQSNIVLVNVQVTVDTTEIDFDVIGFIEPSTRVLTVANTGQVPVQFEFIKKLNDKSICKPWLSVEPSSGFIMPGDKVGGEPSTESWGQFHESKVKSKIPTCGIPLNFNGLFSTFFG